MLKPYISKLIRFLKINFLFLWVAILALYFIQIGVMMSNPTYGTGNWGTNAWANGIKFVINETTVAGTNVIFIMILLWLVTIITNRIPVTLILASVVTAMAAIAEFQVINVRQEAITEASLQEITAFKDLLGMLDIKLVVCAAILLIVIAVLLFIIYRRSRWVVFRSIRWRAVLLVLSVLVIMPFFSINSEKYEASFVKLGDVPKVWDSLFDATSNGGIMALLNSRTTDAMVEPKSYSQQTMKNLVTKYTKQASLINQTRENSNFKNQTVIYTLSESLTKPSYVPGLTISDDPLPNIDNIMDNTSSGHMVSSGYGGGTAGIEYSTLTGFNITSYRPTVTMPYSQLTSSINEKSTITGQFDNKIVVHPYVGSFYNRRAVYKNMGINYF
ncbi:sulfatase-like hydrolase/transferase [Leuconostoc falkenbergense]|nr:sulfatase-like hydrolase/transferase [Leuconostoc falkenbergense]